MSPSEEEMSLPSNTNEAPSTQSTTKITRVERNNSWCGSTSQGSQMKKMRKGLGVNIALKSTFVTLKEMVRPLSMHI